MKFLFTFLAMTGTTIGHLIMNSPVPFGVDTLNNSPLVDAKPGSSTSDFPCKQRPGVYKITAMNTMAVGDTQLLNFTGSASHGGGSCQIAVTMDLEPTITSTWKVIQVFEGGCPISADGNDGTHPFTFEIPPNFPNGRATLSWTWYNRIGNREIYQNCAPITVTGGSDSNDFYNSLPNWYIINLPTSECSTVESTDQIIPNPGQFVLSNTIESNTLASATGPSCAASAATQTSGVSGYQTAIVTDGAAYSAPVKNMDVTGPAPTGAGSAATTIIATSTGSQMSPGITGSLSESAPTPTSTSSYATLSVGPSDGISGPTTAYSTAASVGVSSASPSASVATSIPAPDPSTIAGNTTSSGSGSSDSGCSEQGAVVCNGPSQFGLCNNGAVVWQDVAAGTTCSDGQIMRKRDVRRLSVRRQLQSLGKRLLDSMSAN